MSPSHIGCAPAGGKEIPVSKFGRIAVETLGLLAVFLAVPAAAQNLDAGKTPAQIFADTCSSCHRRAQELRKPSASFLRSHYTTGQDEAAAMASYLAGIPADPRAGQQKKQSGPTPAEAIPTRRQEQGREPKEQAKTQQTPTGASKGRRPANAEAKAPAAAAPAVAPQVSPPEPIPEPAVVPPPPPPAPPPEAFEE
jgi:hypothetical protein